MYPYKSMKKPRAKLITGQNDVASQKRLHSERLKVVLTGIEVQVDADIKKHPIRLTYTSANRWAYGFVKLEFASCPSHFQKIHFN